MMRSTLLILILLSTYFIQAQFDCDNIKVVGTYFSRGNSGDMIIMLTNTSSEDDGNTNVYTGLSMVTNQGDSLTTAEVCQCFILPTKAGDTITYDVALNEGLANSTVPKSYCGALQTEFPDCDISYCKDSIVIPDLPYNQGSDCDYLKVVGLYERANNGTKDHYLMLTFTNPNVIGNVWGYASFQFFDQKEIAISEKTGPHYFLPTFVGDTILVPMIFFEEINSDFCANIKMENPSCELQYCHNISTSIKEVTHDFYLGPNPTKDLIRVNSDYPIAKLAVFDTGGLLLLEAAQNHISMSKFPSGVYIAVATFKDGSKAVEKIMKY